MIETHYYPNSKVFLGIWTTRKYHRKTKRTSKVTAFVTFNARHGLLGFRSQQHGRESYSTVFMASMWSWLRDLSSTSTLVAHVVAPWIRWFTIFISTW